MLNAHIELNDPKTDFQSCILSSNIVSIYSSSNIVSISTIKQQNLLKIDPSFTPWIKKWTQRNLATCMAVFCCSVAKWCLTLCDHMDYSKLFLISVLFQPNIRVIFSSLDKKYQACVVGKGASGMSSWSEGKSVSASCRCVVYLEIPFPKI